MVVPFTNANAKGMRRLMPPPRTGGGPNQRLSTSRAG